MKIFFDENFPSQLADGLNAFERVEQMVEVVSTITEFGRGVKDEDLIPQIGRQNGILFTRDQRIQKTRLYIELIREHEMGIVFIRQSNKMQYWQIVEHVVKSWCGTKKKCRVQPPFALQVTGKGKIETLDL